MQKKQHPHVLPDHKPLLFFQTLNEVIFHPIKAHFNKITQNLKPATLNGSSQYTATRTFPQIFSKLWESTTVRLTKTGF